MGWQVNVASKALVGVCLPLDTDGVEFVGKVLLLVISFPSDYRCIVESSFLKWCGVA